MNDPPANIELAETNLFSTLLKMCSQNLGNYPILSSLRQKNYHLMSCFITSRANPSAGCCPFLPMLFQAQVTNLLAFWHPSLWKSRIHPMPPCPKSQTIQFTTWTPRLEFLGDVKSSQTSHQDQPVPLIEAFEFSAARA